MLQFTVHYDGMRIVELFTIRACDLEAVLADIHAESGMVQWSSIETLPDVHIDPVLNDNNSDNNRHILIGNVSQNDNMVPMQSNLTIQPATR